MSEKTTRYRYVGGLDDVVFRVGDQEFLATRGDVIEVPAGALDNHTDFEPAPKKADRKLTESKEE